MLQVLVIDDAMEVRSVTTAMLKQLGLEVVCARDGEEGLDMVKSSLPDLVISDIVMPRMDGIRLFRTVREDDALAGLPWVMMSSPDREREALAAGCPHFLTKPFTLNDLADLLNSALKLPD